jgi:hypothetical protein
MKEKVAAFRAGNFCGAADAEEENNAKSENPYSLESI